MNAIERLAFGRTVTEDRAMVRAAPRPATALAGRVLLSLIFVLSGIDKIANWSGGAAYMEAQGMFWVPVFLFLAILIEIAGGLSIASGTYARIGALVLFLYLIPVTLVFHNFWALEGAERQNQMAHFMKNLAILGGLLMIVADGAGRYSVDRKMRGRTRPA